MEEKRSSFWLCELLARACRCIIKTHRIRRPNIEGIDGEKGFYEQRRRKTSSFQVHTRLIHEGYRNWCCHRRKERSM